MVSAFVQIFLSIPANLTFSSRTSAFTSTDFLCSPSNSSSQVQMSCSSSSATMSYHSPPPSPSPSPSYTRAQFLKFTAVLLATQLPLSDALPAEESNRPIGEFGASGFIFKDTIKVSAINDPKVQGVTLYISDFERPINERIQKNFFNEPSYASVACVKTGVVEVSDTAARGRQGEELFSESRNLIFKQIRIRRIIDDDARAVIYVIYNTRLFKEDDENKSRFKTGICSVSMD